MNLILISRFKKKKISKMIYAYFCSKLKANQFMTIWPLLVINIYFYLEQSKKKLSALYFKQKKII